jgi:hypothetical protein
MKRGSERKGSGGKPPVGGLGPSVAPTYGKTCFVVARHGVFSTKVVSPYPGYPAAYLGATEFAMGYAQSRARGFFVIRDRLMCITRARAAGPEAQAGRRSAVLSHQWLTQYCQSDIEAVRKLDDGVRGNFHRNAKEETGIFLTYVL